MNVTCHNCKTKLNIPDHKIPKDKASTFKCPKCKERVTVPAAKKQQQSFPLPFEERQNALVCLDSDDVKKKAYSIIKQMGFNVEVVTDVKSALNRMEYHIYPLVIFDDTFDQNKGLSGIIDRMNAIDMSLRRRICLVWVSNIFNTNDHMAALNSSVNSIIHIDDIIHLEAILSNILMEHKNIYTVYNVSLKQLGRA